MDAVEIDGSLGEGGGQVLRTSLALAAITGKGVLVKNIRSQRPSPGLKPQHLASLKTVASLCDAKLVGAKPNSKEVCFKPGKILPSNLNVNIGTAGSVSLLLSQVMPVALFESVSLHLHGGTNVPFSPPMEFLKEALFPVLRKSGARLEASVNRRGYYPKGRGLVSFSSKPASLPLKPFFFREQGVLELVKACSHCASLPAKVAFEQAASAKHFLGNLGVDFVEAVECRERSETIGSGISLFAFFSSGAVLSGSALGAKGKPAEKVGKEAAEKLLSQLGSKKPCDLHLADQLIPFMALAGGKSVIETTCFTSHCQTNIAVTEKFLPVKFKAAAEIGKPAKISVSGSGFSGK